LKNTSLTLNAFVINQGKITLNFAFQAEGRIKKKKKFIKQENF
jgi:hypothetical protein